MKNWKHRSNRLKKQANGTVRLAAIYSVGLSEMAEIEARFAQRFPEARAACVLSAAGARLGSGAWKTRPIWV